MKYPLAVVAALGIFYTGCVSRPPGNVSDVPGNATEGDTQSKPAKRLFIIMNSLNTACDTTRQPE